MPTTTRINHKCRTTTGRTVRTPFALGQVWLHRGSRHVVERVFPRKVRFEVYEGRKKDFNYYLTVGQEPFAKHASLVLNP